MEFEHRSDDPCGPMPFKVSHHHHDAGNVVFRWNVFAVVPTLKSLHDDYRTSQTANDASEPKPIRKAKKARMPMPQLAATLHFAAFANPGRPSSPSRRGLQ